MCDKEKYIMPRVGSLYGNRPDQVIGSITASKSTETTFAVWWNSGESSDCASTTSTIHIEIYTYKWTANQWEHDASPDACTQIKHISCTLQDDTIINEEQNVIQKYVGILSQILVIEVI